MSKNNKHLTTGKSAELDACKYLQARGLRLLKQNYQAKVGEIDLIMQDGEYLVFVEVRHRGRNNLENALESISPAKINRIIKTAMIYLIEQNCFYNVPCRFDIIAIHPVEGTMQLEWFQNAFTLDK